VGAASVRLLKAFPEMFNDLLVLIKEFLACFWGTYSRRSRKQQEFNLQSGLFAGLPALSLSN